MSIKKRNKNLLIATIHSLFLKKNYIHLLFQFNSNMILMANQPLDGMSILKRISFSL